MMFDQELNKLKDMFGNGEDLSSEELEDFESIIDFRRRQVVLKKGIGISTSMIDAGESIHDD
jgi:hypothetical protein